MNQPVDAESTRRGTVLNGRMLLRNLLWWATAAFIAIVGVQEVPLVGLAVAVLGGVGLGILLFRADSA